MRNIGRRIRAARAFALVELAIALAIMSALFGLAVPSFARFVAEQKLLGEARRLSEGITLARSEAVKRNGHVVICAATPAKTCTEDHDWHEGWVMFADGDGNATIDEGDAVLSRDGRAEAGVSMVGNRPVDHYLRFNYTGQARLVSGALQMGTIEVCKTGFAGYRLVLANSGRTRIERTAAPCP